MVPMSAMGCRQADRQAQDRTLPIAQQSVLLPTPAATLDVHDASSAWA